MLVALPLLAGCGLPLEEGVQRPGPAVERAAAPGDVNVLPPDPRPDADALAVVQDFIGAQSSPQGRHAVARKYLAEGVDWDDSGAQVFTRRDGGREVAAGVVQVTYRVTGRIRPDGTWLTEPRTDVATYKLRRLGQTWRLTSVPRGLHLSPRDRDRSFSSRSVHFVSPTSTSGRLVAEPVFQPVTADAAQSLVERLLLGPSDDLAPAVVTAFPRGTRLRGPVVTEGGTVTVDLDDAVERLEQPQRRQLSAQLVWTLRELPGFATLRLLSGGRPLLVGGREEQRRDDYDEQSPVGLPASAPLYYLQGRSLRTLPAGTPVPGERPPADDVAVSPSGERLGVLTRTGARTTISTGPLEGPLVTRAALAGVTSPTWGSGELGLFFLERGRVRLLRGSEPEVRDVPVERAGGGPVTALAVSRDGARVALVRSGALLVGRVEPVPEGFRVAGLRAVAPRVRDVEDVVWRDATTVVALGRTSAQERTPVDVSVDGAQIQDNTRIGVKGSPAAVAAAADEDLVVAARGRLYRDTLQVFALLAAGSAPTYPG